MILIIFLLFSFHFYSFFFSGCKCLSVRSSPDWPPAPAAALLDLHQSPRPVNSPRDSNKDNSPEFSAWTLLSSSHSIRYPDRVRHSREPHHPKKQKQQVRMIKLLLDWCISKLRKEKKKKIHYWFNYGKKNQSKKLFLKLSSSNDLNSV